MTFVLSLDAGSEKSWEDHKFETQSDHWHRTSPQLTTTKTVNKTTKPCKLEKQGEINFKNDHVIDAKVQFFYYNVSKLEINQNLIWEIHNYVEIITSSITPATKKKHKGN